MEGEKEMNKKLLLVISLMFLSLFVNIGGESIQKDINDEIKKINTIAVDTKVNITILAESHWSPVGYNITVSVTGVYDSSGAIWNGTAVLNITTGEDPNPSDQIYYPSSDIDGNFTIGIISITNPDDPSLTDFEVVRYDWCVWDVLTSKFSYYWETDADNDTDYAFLHWHSGVWYWKYNTTFPTNIVYADVGQLFVMYVNGSAMDSALLDNERQIPDLIAGPYSAVVSFIQVEVKAVGITLGNKEYIITVYNSSFYPHIETEYNLTGSFVDGGAIAYISNQLDCRNLIEVCVYDGNISNYKHAPKGVLVYLKLNSSNYSSGYEVNRTTNHNGFVYWLVTQDMIGMLGNGEVDLYYHTSSNEYILIQRFTAWIFSASIAEARADTTGIHIRLSISPPSEVTHLSKGEFEYIIGLENSYYWVLDVGKWTTTGTGNLLDIYVDTILSTTVSCTLEIVQSMEADWLFKSGYINFVLSPELEVTERQLFVTESKVGFSGTISADASYYIYEDTGSGYLLKGSGFITAGSFFIEWDRVYGLSLGSVNFSIHFVHGSQELILNGTYSVGVPSVGVVIENVYVGENTITVTGTAQRNFSWYIYNDGVYSGEHGVGHPMSFSFSFAKETSPGDHIFSIYINVSINGVEYYRWHNGSYYISTEYGLCTVTLYNSRGTGFDQSVYVLYVNDSRHTDWTFYDRTNAVYNITITDYFGRVIYSGMHNYSRYIDIGVSFYTFKVYSQMSEEFVYFNLTAPNGARYSQHIGPGEVVTYYLVSGTYYYAFTKTNGPNEDLYSGQITLNADASFVITDVSLREILVAVQQDISARPNLEPMMSSIDSVMSSINVLQTSMWLFGAVIIGIMIISVYAKDTETAKSLSARVRKKKAKGEVPEHLKPYVFKPGPENPNYRGYVSKDRMRDWRDYYES